MSGVDDEDLVVARLDHEPGRTQGRHHREAEGVPQTGLHGGIVQGMVPGSWLISTGRHPTITPRA